MSFPIQPIYLLADSQLLFYQEDGQPFLQRLQQDLADKDSLKAAYIGASNGDLPEFFAIFEAAMESIGITDCRMIFAEYGDEDADYLQQADIILLAGGDVARGWRAINESGMRQELIHRYYGGAVLMGVSAGAVQLGMKGWKGDSVSQTDDMFDCFQLIPFALDAHDEVNNWDRLKASLTHSANNDLKGIGIPSGGGFVYHVDHTIEPIRFPLVTFQKNEQELCQTLLLPGENVTTVDGSPVEQA